MDYVYYRIYKFYKTKDYIPMMMGIYFLMIFYVSTAFLVGIILDFSSNGVISLSQLDKGLTKGIWIFFLLSLFLFNAFRYGSKDKVATIIEHYEGHKLNKRVKTWQIFILPLVNIFIAVIIIVIFN